MNKYKTILLLLLIINSASSAQKYGRIKGEIADSIIKLRLPGSIITLTNTKLGANADIDGQYAIDSIPVGDYTVRAHMMGYPDKLIKKVHIGNDTTRILNISLFLPPNKIMDFMFSQYRYFNPYSDSSHIVSFKYAGGNTKPKKIIDKVYYTLYEKPGKRYYKENISSHYIAGTPSLLNCLNRAYFLIPDLIMKNTGIIDLSHLNDIDLLREGNIEYYKLNSEDTCRVRYILLVDCKTRLLRRLIVSDYRCKDGTITTTIDYYPKLMVKQ